MLRATTLALFLVGVLASFPASAETKAASAGIKKDDGRARVFVPVSDSWSIGAEFEILEEGKGGAKPQTAEIVKTMHERCPQVIVTRNEESADYILVLEHEGGKVFVRKDNKYAVFRADGDAIGSGSTRSLGNAVKDACGVIMSDWQPELTAEP